MKTYATKVLPGWMSQQDALKILCEEKVPPLSNADALLLWGEYRDKVAALKPRKAECPPYLTLSNAERLYAERILAKRRRAPNIRRVVKVDPMKVVVHQLQVTTDHCAKYASQMGDGKARAKLCLGSGLRGAKVRETKTAGKLTLHLPHYEFNLGIDPQKRQWALQEQAPWVSVTEFDGRLLLWAGYHRTYAVSNHTYPDETERLLLAVLTTDAELFLGAASRTPERRDIVRGDRPPVFADFFNDALCLNLILRGRQLLFEIDLRTQVASRRFVDE